jgi:ATP-binding cassette subfamily B protein
LALTLSQILIAVTKLQFCSFFVFGPMQEMGNVIIAYREAEASLNNFQKLLNSSNYGIIFHLYYL